MGDPPGLKISYKEQQEPLGTEAGVTGPLSPMGSVLSPRGGGGSVHPSPRRVEGVVGLPLDPGVLGCP